MGGCTYAEFLQAYSYPFDTVEFFSVGCLDALLCLPSVSESFRSFMLAFRMQSYCMMHVPRPAFTPRLMQARYLHVSVSTEKDVISLVM